MTFSCTKHSLSCSDKRWVNLFIITRHLNFIPPQYRNMRINYFLILYGHFILTCFFLFFNCK
ncbi:Uncharacterized protein APZ42_011267 [Daphnia magna]|uniref:Uncharacterized protein n=1 Tax=Daphnia magna TaxID=35525 RepID=A0A162SIP8_9CRUS|nr:Uncharacterized protein APZ42_011267 [Daphnia magna]